MDILTRKQAADLGLKKYFTGKPCSHGHTCVRFTYNSACFDCSGANAQRWKDENRVRYRADCREYARKNAKRQNATAKKWALENLERSRANVRNWYIKNFERKSRINKIWSLNNKERIRAKERNRGARERGNGGRHTHEDVMEIAAMQKGKCAYFVYCGTEVTTQNWHVDHIIPLLAGGSNGRHNLQILCRTCNLSKGSRDPMVHCRSLGWLL